MALQHERQLAVMHLVFGLSDVLSRAGKLLSHSGRWIIAIRDLCSQRAPVRVRFGHERATVTSHRKPVPAIVPIHDLGLPGQIEDEIELVTFDAIADAGEVIVIRSEAAP